MIIDFHTHVFPDKMAEKAIEVMEKKGGDKAVLRGTVGELRDSMTRAGVDLSVNLPVATKPSQFKTINKFAAENTAKYDDIISFGGIHPYTEHYREELKEIKDMGFLGIKIHPDYQDVPFDDISVIRIIDYASELGLIVVTHAGYDPAFSKTTKCTPQSVVKVLNQIDPPKLVLAHMGGLFYFDEVEELIVGRNVYLDTAYLLSRFKNDEQIERIIKNHGADKVLFATDSPWSDQKGDIQHFKKFNISDEDKEKILYKNALKLLELKEKEI